MSPTNPSGYGHTKRLALAHLPTPLEPAPRLGEAMGLELWVKRDDATGGPEAGNKIRKLEFLLADAVQQDCDTVITCGGMQSNHARATAVLAARLGLRALLMLRDDALDDDEGRGRALTEPAEANVLIARMVGAEVRRVTRSTYGRRDEVMGRWADELRAEGRAPYVIGEGGSSGLGALGYVAAMAEIRRQLDAGLADRRGFDAVVHGCGSGGTAAGVVLGAAHYEVAAKVIPFAVCDDAPTFEQRIGQIITACRQLAPELAKAAPYRVDESGRGPAYGVSTEAQRRDMVAAAQLSGLVFDPVYSGKALHGLWQRARSGELAGARVLFVHTGGLPGLLAQAPRFAGQL